MADNKKPSKITRRFEAIAWVNKQIAELEAALAAEKLATEKAA